MVLGNGDCGDDVVLDLNLMPHRVRFLAWGCLTSQQPAHAFLNPVIIFAEKMGGRPWWESVPSEKALFKRWSL